MRIADIGECRENAWELPDCEHKASLLRPLRQQSCLTITKLKSKFSAGSPWSRSRTRPPCFGLCHKYCGDNPFGEAGRGAHGAIILARATLDLNCIASVFQSFAAKRQNKPQLISMLQKWEQPSNTRPHEAEPPAIVRRSACWRRAKIDLGHRVGGFQLFAANNPADEPAKRAYWTQGS